MLNTVRYLDWDSDFFSMKIASISMSVWDEVFFRYNIEKLRLEGVDLVYFFLDDNKYSLPTFHSPDKCLLVDTKRIYKFHDMVDVLIDSNIELFVDDPSELYELAIQAGVDSRYRLDPNFDSGEFERLYKTWIDNSLNGSIADYVLVYKKNGAKVGFITLRCRVNCMSIGLIATDKSYRCLGVGTSLLNVAKHYAFTHHLPLEVATQAHNQSACIFYEKNGFLQQSQSLVYHIWLH